MIRIKLVCATGVSSNLLVDVLTRKTQDKKIHCEITASSIMNIQNAIDTSDVVILGPQYGYKLEDIQALAKNKCAIVTLKEYEYSSINADQIIDKAIVSYNTFKNND